MWCPDMSVFQADPVQFAPQDLCGSQQSEFYGRVVYRSSSLAPEVHGWAFKASQTHGSLAFETHVTKQEWLTSTATHEKFIFSVMNNIGLFHCSKPLNHSILVKVAITLSKKTDL